MATEPFDKTVQGLSILVADKNHFMRRLTRTMLMNLGAKSVIEASDGLAALEAIRTCDPDVMLLEWDLPVLDGAHERGIAVSRLRVDQPSLDDAFVALTSNDEAPALSDGRASR